MGHVSFLLMYAAEGSRASSTNLSASLAREDIVGLQGAVQVFVHDGRHGGKMRRTRPRTVKLSER